MYVALHRQFVQIGIRSILTLWLGASLPLDKWFPHHVRVWRDSLPPDDRENFKEFFDNLPAGVKGSTLASYDKTDVEKRFKTEEGRAFAPEVYAKLQGFKREGMCCQC